MRLVHLTHPKSGSHWVTDVLSDPEVLKHASPETRFKRCEDHTLHDWAQEADGFFMGPMFSMTYPQWVLYRKPGDKAICVLRDPRDCIVSWTFSFSYSHETQPHVALIRPVLLSSPLRRRLMIGTYQYWQSAWIVRTWAGRWTTGTEFLTTYEKILGDEPGEFGAMFEFLGWNVPLETVERVVAYHSFEKRTRGRERGKLDTYSHYRRGEPGDWRNYFDRSLGEMFERACPRLLTQLGYERSDSWFENLPETVWALSDGDSVENAPASLAAAKEIAHLREQRDETRKSLRESIRALDRVVKSPVKR